MLHITDKKYYRKLYSIIIDFILSHAFLIILTRIYSKFILNILSGVEKVYKKTPNNNNAFFYDMYKPLN